MMADFVNTIDLLGEEETAAAIISKTITEFNDDTLVEIGQYSFDSCYSLQSINLPNVEQIGSNAFYGSQSYSQLSNVNLPKVKIIGRRAFYGNKLTHLYLPSIASLESEAFQFCKQLSFADLSNIDTISTSVFNACENLRVLIIRSEKVCTLNHVNTFYGSPFYKSSGTVYVYQRFITEYQNATNWSTLYAQGTCNFVAIEGSEYE